MCTDTNLSALEIAASVCYLWQDLKRDSNQAVSRWNKNGTDWAAYYRVVLRVDQEKRSRYCDLPIAWKTAVIPENLLADVLRQSLRWKVQLTAHDGTHYDGRWVCL